jgi:hypothetical protein
MVEEKKTETSSDLNHFDAIKYSEFIKANISSVLDETYDTTFRKLIEINTNSIMNQVHRNMSNYIYDHKTDTEIDLDSQEYKTFTREFEKKLSKNVNGCWCGGESELKRCSKNVIVRTINTYIEKYKLIYIKHIDLPYKSSDSNVSKDIYIYIFSSKIIIFQFLMESFNKRTEQYITMYSYSYDFIPQFVIDIFELVNGVSRDSQGYPIDGQTLTPNGFDMFMTQVHSLFKKFEQNPFYFLSGNSRFHQDIVKQKKKLEQQLEIFNKEKIDFEAEKEKVNSILNIESKLEEIKKENFKRLKILKKIKQEKLLIEEERKKLEELKESLNNSDIDLDEVTI